MSDCETKHETCVSCLNLLTYLFGYYEHLQLGANFGYPTLYILSHLVSPILARPSYSATSTTLCRFKNFTNWVGAIHTSDMTQPSKTLYFNTLHYVDVIVHIVQLLVPIIQISPIITF